MDGGGENGFQWLHQSLCPYGELGAANTKGIAKEKSGAGSLLPGQAER